MDRVSRRSAAKPLRKKGNRTGPTEANNRLLAENRKLAEANRKLAKARDAAVAANDSKSSFLASVSHELRTPMSGIIGFTDLLLASRLTTDQRENLCAVKNSAESLLALLNDLLDLSKIEAGKLEVERSDFCLRELLNEAMKPLALRAHAKLLKLSLQVDDQLPDGLVGDALRLRQVLTNLAGNAIKFTETGEVTVRVELIRCDGSVLLARFSVEDTGVGIPQEKQSLIFQAYRQADGAVARKYGGTGLGLAISARLVGLMGGRIALKSEPGKGSTFEFTIPLGIRHCMVTQCGTVECPVRIVSFPRRRLLVAEDHPVNRKLAVKLLEQYGHEVCTAADGAEALALLERETFDLVLMDVEMPEMDGIAATRAIRAKERPGAKRLPIIAMTAHALKGDRERFLSAGMDAYVSKPFRGPDLIAVIESTLAAENRSAGV